MWSLEQAVEHILAALPPPTSETVPLSEALGRVALEPVVSPMDLPRFDNSAMDGYAVRAADVVGASSGRPVALRLRGQVAAGEVFSGTIETGECVRLYTGSALPGGADAVVMQEDTRIEASEAKVVQVLAGVKPLENVRLRGEDVKSGAPVLRPGERISAARLSLLAALGVGDVRVGRSPRIALLATGNELREPGQPLGPGQIYESNRLTLAALTRSTGASTLLYPLVPDTLRATEQALEQALTEADIVVSSGGVSVGGLDFVKPAVQQLGGELGFWKVAIKPGKPFVFGRIGPKFLFGLPGNPVSAFVTFLLLVRPALLRWQGAVEVSLPGHPGVLDEALSNQGDRRHFVRVCVDLAGRVRTAGVQASHVLGSLAACNGLVDVPPATRLSAGTAVTVLRWE
jgi:molybdopterin molybdotransferase